MMPAFTPRPAERVGLLDAAGRHLATDLAVRTDAPAFDNSAMDGYAVRAAELEDAGEEAPVELPVAGESRAGGPPPAPLPEGAAMRIFTGAPLPAGADAVVVQEDTERRGDRVALRFAPKPAHHVRQRGSDLRAGEPLLGASAPIGPGAIGLLASQGIGELDVHRRPRVALLSTGDELRDLSEPARPGSIVNSNAYMLAALVRSVGAEPLVLPRAGDDLDALTTRVRAGLEADLLVTTGGVSVGEYDLVREAMERAGVEMGFWKIAIKPGKPLAFGAAGATPVVGLPGNPVSAFVTFHVFVAPGLRRMAGDPAPHLAPRPVRLGDPFRHRPGRTQLVRARLEDGEDGPVACLHGRQGSGDLASIAWADALVVLPGERERFEPGDSVAALPLRAARAATPSFA